MIHLPTILAGILGGKALLVVDGSAPRSVAPGGSHMGVRVVSVGRDGVVLEVAGAQRAIQLGESPVSIGGSAAGQRGTDFV